jgi:hypothetical protein
MAYTREQKSDFRGHDRRLMFAMILGPMAALTDLGIAYSLSPTACEQASKTLLHTTSVAFLLMSLCAALIARTATDTAEKSRWMVNVAVVLSLFSAVVIIAMEIPNWILRSCD